MNIKKILTFLLLMLSLNQLNSNDNTSNQNKTNKKRPKRSSIRSSSIGKNKQKQSKSTQGHRRTLSTPNSNIAGFASSNSVQLQPALTYKESPIEELTFYLKNLKQVYVDNYDTKGLSKVYKAEHAKFKNLIESLLTYIEKVSNLKLADLKVHEKIFRELNKDPKFELRADSYDEDDQNISPTIELIKNFSKSTADSGITNNFKELYEYGNQIWNQINNDTKLKNILNNDMINDVVKNLKLNNIYTLFLDILSNIEQSLLSSQQHVQLNGHFLTFSFTEDSLKRVLGKHKNIVIHLMSKDNEKNESHICSYLNMLIKKEPDHAVKIIENIVKEVKSNYSFTTYNEEEFKSLELFKDPSTNNQPHNVLILDKREPKLDKTKVLKFLMRCAKMYHFHGKYYLVLIILPWRHTTSPEVNVQDEVKNDGTKGFKYSLTGWHWKVDAGNHLTPLKYARKDTIELPYQIKTIFEDRATEVKRVEFTIPLLGTSLENEVTDKNSNKLQTISKASDEYPATWGSEDNLRHIVIDTLKNALVNLSYTVKGRDIEVLGQYKHLESQSDTIISYFIEQDKEHPEAFAVKTNFPIARIVSVEKYQDLYFDFQSISLPTYTDPRLLKTLILYSHLKTEENAIEDELKEINDLEATIKELSSSRKAARGDMQEYKDGWIKAMEEDQLKRIKRKKAKIFITALALQAHKEEEFDKRVYAAYLKNGNLLIHIKTDDLGDSHSVLVKSNIAMRIRKYLEEAKNNLLLPGALKMASDIE